MDPESLQSLGRRFWQAWLAGVVSAATAIFVGVVLVSPENALVVAIYGILSVLFAGFTVVSLKQGDGLDAAGSAVSMAGMVILSFSAVAGFPGASLWVGFGVAGFGGTVGLLADHGDRIRGAVGG